MKFVTPKAYLIGRTTMLFGLHQYLENSGNYEFTGDMDDATHRLNPVSDTEQLCSFYAKLCYKSLTPGHNKNISTTRSIEDNLKSVITSGHHSILEHGVLNFVFHNVSRVFTHELIRHRVGTAYAQTSGRYVREAELCYVMDPILTELARELRATDPDSSLVPDIELALEHVEDEFNEIWKKIDDLKIKDFSRKKKITSALRRMLPNGMANDIGFTCNFRELRHIITLRTSRHAEWEMREVFNQVYNLVKDSTGVVLFDAHCEHYDGLYEITFEHGAH